MVHSLHTHLFFCLFSLEWPLYTVSIDILGEANSERRS